MPKILENRNDDEQGQGQGQSRSSRRRKRKKQREEREKEKEKEKDKKVRISFKKILYIYRMTYEYDMPLKPFPRIFNMLNILFYIFIYLI